MDDSPDDFDLEKAHYMEVRHAFLEYSTYMEKEVQRLQDNLDKLPKAIASMLPTDTTKRKLAGMKQAIARNQTFLNAVVEFQDRSSPFPLTDADFATGGTSKTTPRQIDKVSTTLHQMMRDWSLEGAEEREQSYDLVMRELERLVPVDKDRPGDIRVLVPGAGLGRLALELVSRGYSTQGNEFSYFMLMVSNFMLNGISQADAFSVSPFVDNRCNNFAVDDILRTLRVPDVCASEMLDMAGGAVDFSMSAGEWLDAYSDQTETFDSIITVFFLDTAPVVMEYIQTISRLLKAGGVWINFGPLLYHWAQGAPGETDQRFARSVELTWEEIRHVCANYGLEIVHEEKREALYNANRSSLMKTTYTGVLCCAVKNTK